MSGCHRPTEMMPEPCLCCTCQDKKLEDKILARVDLLEKELEKYGRYKTDIDAILSRPHKCPVCDGF